MTLRQAVEFIRQCLNDYDIDEADFKALCLVCGAAGIKNNAYPLHRKDTVDEAAVKAVCRRACSGEPVQYILGKWDFFESEFTVGKGVLIPRPETEELVTQALQRADGITKPVIVDLCAGSGCIGISLAKKLPDSTVYCIEKSPAAFAYLQKNAEGVANVKTVLADITKATNVPKADMIVSNPPYIKTAVLPTLQSEVQFEPAMALDGGEDGLDFYRCINALWYRCLKPQGQLFLEIGDEQGEAVRELLTNFTDILIQPDSYGKDRFVIATVK